MEAHPTSVGDSAAYERRNLSCDDVVIVSACRTALCKAKRGGFKDTPVDDLIAAVLKETIARTGVEPEVRRRAAAARRLGQLHPLFAALLAPAARRLLPPPRNQPSCCRCRCPSSPPAPRPWATCAWGR